MRKIGTAEEYSAVAQATLLVVLADVVLAVGSLPNWWTVLSLIINDSQTDRGKPETSL